jgi:aspartyl-tRNA(Asn)/glutamyl-tRNA(Gln) amidotransferase subunit B
MEEDAGKSLHEGFPDSDRTTYVDLNRSGTPLIEVVTHPDLRSSREAQEYLMRLREVLEYLGVCDGNMEEGSLRCDANVSIRPEGSEVLGTRTELKNINSFRFLGRAIDYEIERQTDVLESGGTVVQETRLWDDVQGRSLPMRSKEEAHDYRYFPEPDLGPLVLERSWVEQIAGSLPELPSAKRERFVGAYGLSEYDAGVLTSTRALAGFFEEAASDGRAKEVANWVMGDLMKLMNDDGLDLGNLSSLRVRPAMLAEMVAMIGEGTISGKIAKTVLAEMYGSGRGPRKIVESAGLEQISDSGEIERIVAEVVHAHPGPAAEYRSGKQGTIGWFVGQVMKATEGRANPKQVNELLRKRLAAADQ